MSEIIRCGAKDTLLAATRMSFDISLLELLWPLMLGARIVIAEDEIAALPRHRPARIGNLAYSLFYFASAEQESSVNKYRLLIEGTKFAERNGFLAVWTPERHFHPFGGLYPNPSVTSAALAAITERIRIRAGSVVLPLHDVVRVAEEWSVVDNLSGGRVGIAFASGWHANDFVLAPEQYENRKEVTFRNIETFLKLWRGESIRRTNPKGKDVEVRLFPKPVQDRLPIWITAAGNPETFIRAGEIGANVLTHLLGQTVEEVGEKIRLYREARARSGHDPEQGRITLMLHTFLGENEEHVKEIVRKPFLRYLRSSVDLMTSLAA
jgi:natural product biosynthesis luciferase-like monooxygenase protein